MATADPPEAPRAGVPGTVLVVALVLTLAFQLAYWTWVFVAPPRTAAAPASGEAVDLAAIARLFGASPPAGAASAATASSLRLKGVVAPTPGVAASAIFASGAGRDVSVYIGREVAPGVKLAEVHPDHVIVERAGVAERIDLDRARSVASVPGAAGGARAHGFKLDVARAGNQFTFSRAGLDQALRDPNQLNYLGRIGQAPDGGVRLELAPPGSLAHKLGLQPGDVIRKVNGQAVASQGDLARLYTQFATLNAVQAEIARGGSTLVLSYSIQP